MDTGSERVSVLGTEVSLKVEKGALATGGCPGTRGPHAVQLLAEHATPRSHTASPTVAALPGGDLRISQEVALHSLVYSFPQIRVLSHCSLNGVDAGLG